MSQLSPRDLERAVRDREDPLRIVFNHWHLSNPSVARLARPVLKLFWSDLEYYLTDVSRVYEAIVSERPEAREVLDTPEGRRYLNYCVSRMYSAFYDYVWREVDPLVELADR